MSEAFINNPEYRQKGDLGVFGGMAVSHQELSWSILFPVLDMLCIVVSL
jgi:hypothetical protein